jgi:hypothetical protein
MTLDLASHPEAYGAIHIENLTHSGEQLRLIWTNKAIVDDRGRLQGILGIGIDLTW